MLCPEYVYVFFLYMILKIFPVFGSIIHVINFNLFFFTEFVNFHIILSLQSLFSVRSYLSYTCTCYWYVLMMDLRWRETAGMGKVFRKAGHVNYTERKPRMTEGSVERNCVPVSLHGDVFC